MIALENKTAEQLIEQIRRMQDRLNLLGIERAKKEDAYISRLSNFRKAKALANARADKAERALKSIIEIFCSAKMEKALSDAS